MRLTVYPPYRNYIGQDSISLDLPPGATVRTLLETLGERHPSFSALARAKSDEFLWGQVTIHVNEAQAGLGTVLAADDHIDLMPPIAGGA
jgi:molybdopterin converting factor small subunit